MEACTCQVSSILTLKLVSGFLLQQLEGDLETLAIVTYSLVSLSLVALLLTFFFLTCLKGLKSNTRGIYSNIAATLFFSELLFLLGINRTENQVRGRSQPLCSQAGRRHQTRELWRGLLARGEFWGVL